MPRELNDRLLMKTYYVVVEDVSFNARAVNSPFRNPLVLPCITLRGTSYSDNARASSELILHLQEAITTNVNVNACAIIYAKRIAALRKAAC